MVSKLWQATFVAVITLCFVWKVSGLMCYECFNCETSFNSSHLKNCTKAANFCVKTLLMNGEADRACGDKKRCAGRDPRQRQTRSISSNDNDFDGRGRRIPRGLLDSAGPAKKEQLGAAEASSIHCCHENECNGSPPGTIPSIAATIVVSAVIPHLLRFII